MKGKNILVTGASSGIGYAFAKYASHQGATVFATARRIENLNKLCEECEGEVYSIPFDLSNVHNLEDVFQFIVKQGKKLDALVYCAGITGNEPMRTICPDTMENVLKTNYTAFIQMCKFFSKKKYSNDGAAIVGISSLATQSFEKGSVSYTASKAAMNSSIVIMAKEFVHRKIRVNGIAPNFVDTEMWRETILSIEGKQEEIERMQKLGVIPCEQISYLIEFLISDRSEYITGAIVPVTGGWL